MSIKLMHWFGICASFTVMVHHFVCCRCFFSLSATPFSAVSVMIPSSLGRVTLSSANTSSLSPTVDPESITRLSLLHGGSLTSHNTNQRLCSYSVFLLMTIFPNDLPKHSYQWLIFTEMVRALQQVGAPTFCTFGVWTASSWSEWSRCQHRFELSDSWNSCLTFLTVEPTRYTHTHSFHFLSHLCCWGVFISICKCKMCCLFFTISMFMSSFVLFVSRC